MVVESPSKKRRRPFGIYAVILLILLTQLLILLTYLDILPLYISALFPVGSGTRLADAYHILNAVLAVLMVVGLWRLRRWAWVLTMILVGVDLAVGLWTYLHATPDYLGMLIDVIMVFYLNQGDVQETFERRRSPGATV